MTLFELTRVIHTSCALVSITGFALRGYWMVTSNPTLQHRLCRVLPHLVDTLLLGSAIAMLLMWGVSPLQVDWLLAKVIALLLYIGLGMVALRFGRTLRVRAGALLAALVTALYMISVAYTKNPWGILGL
ncbi:MAG: SirB2 family protein [Halioglobus sp.]